jgi:hypothetical protein
MRTLEPIEVAILISIPTLLAGLYVAWTIWRREHSATPPAE